MSELGIQAIRLVDGEPVLGSIGGQMDFRKGYVRFVVEEPQWTGCRG